MSADISKRDFLRLIIMPFAQACIACVYHHTEDPTPSPDVLLKSSAFLTDFNGKTVAGEDEISIEWTNGDVFPMILMFSPDGVILQTLATLTDNTPYIWTVPQLNTNNAFFKLVSSYGDIRTAVFSIRTSLVISLNIYPALETSGNYEVITTNQHGDVAVRNIGNGFLTLSLTCTHAGCTAQYGPEIYCSCHGSRFTTNGAVINGPASRPLKTFYTKHVVSQRKLLIYE